jgi:hypothetical protein
VLRSSLLGGQAPPWWVNLSIGLPKGTAPPASGVLFRVKKSIWVRAFDRP